MAFNRNTMNSDEVQKLLADYQSGAPGVETPDIPKLGAPVPEVTPGEPIKPSVYQRSMMMPIRKGVAQSDIEEALATGYGTSRYDTDFYSGMDLENTRALSQSGFSKIGTGLGKMATTAATTALNTTLGTVFGVGSAMFELATDSNGNGRSFMDTMDAGVNNWLSGQLLKLENWSEEAMPNYKTEQERSEAYQREWWKHMGTANFIGDSILKNFGFTIGAMGGGFAWSKLIGSAMSKKVANDVMKGVVAASEGDTAANEAMRTAAEAISRGTAVGVDANKLASNIQNAARQINRMDARLQLYGSVIGAMGEGTVEGLMAKQEFLEDYEQKENERFKNEYDNLANVIFNSGNSNWVRKRVVEQPNGELVEVPYLTEAGKNQLLALQRNATENHERNLNFAGEQAEKLASTTFLLNLPILTTSNLVQFGKMFSGGWKTNRALAKVGGGLQRSAEGISGAYTPKGNRIGKTILNALKVSGTEASEEMLQGTASSGAKQVADYYLSAYNDAGYDDEAIHTFRNWFGQMYSGGADYLTDIKNWQEGALGALTGLFGMPGRRWSGGVAEAYRDARDETSASRESANKLNSIVNSKEFQDRWHNYIRHLKYDNEMADALDRDDEYAWHSADDAQLINDVMTFADAGRLEDLNQVVSYYGNISTSDAQSLKEAMSNGGDASQDWTKNASPEQIVEKVKKQAGKMQTTIREYKDVYDALSARAPMGTSPELLKELVFTALQIKAFDRRFLQMFGETMNGIEPILRAMSAVDENGMMVSDESAADRFRSVRDSYERLFAGTLLPVAIPEVLRKVRDAQLDELENITKDNDPELNKKISDMRKLSSERQQFFRKLQTLQGENAEKKFQQAAVTNEKVEQAAEEVHAKQETEGLDTYDAVRRAYLEKNATERADFLQNLSTVEETNKHAKAFLNVMRRIDGFRGFVEKDKAKYAAAAAVGTNAIDSAINMFVNKAKSEADVINLPDNMFVSFDEFARDNKTIFGSASPAMFAAMKQQLRNAMAEYMAMETGTATRNTINPTPVTPQPAPGTVSTPTGYDAAQPASLEPEPAPQPVPPAPPAPAPAEAANESEPVPEKPDVEDLAQEASDAVSDTAPVNLREEKAPDGDNKITFYRTGIPEIVPEEADAARRAIGKGDRTGLMSADLSDFGDKKPEYAEVFNALKERDAFRNVSEAEVGDRVEFVIDPTFPLYDGKYQILMTTTKNGQRRVLSVLSGRTSQYYGLRELRDAIDSEYRAWIGQHPNELFVFSKTSTVWGKRSGLIDYDFEHADDYSEDRGIVNIPGYSEDAPIVFIGRNGKAIVVRGSDKDAAEKVGKEFNDAELNIGNKKRGNLYYLAKCPHGRHEYVPIRLWTEHFRTENKDSGFPVFEKIRNILGEMAKITQETTNLNLDEQNKKLHGQLAELVKYLDVSKDFFDLGIYPNVGVALRHSTPLNDKGTLRRPDRMTEEWLVNFVAGLNRSIQIRKDKNDNIENLNELIDMKLITSNAKMLRPKGVDFYIYPWLARNNDFGPLTPNQQQVENDIAEEKREQAPMPEPSLDDVEFGHDDSGEFFGDDDNNGRDERQALSPEQVQQMLMGRQAGDNISPYVDEPFMELPLEFQIGIKNKGYTEEEYDAMSKKLKEKVLSCLGV